MEFIDVRTAAFSEDRQAVVLKIMILHRLLAGTNSAFCSKVLKFADKILTISQAVHLYL